MAENRLQLVASAVFFCGYLLFQIVYPALPRFLPDYGKFTWQMYAATDEQSRYSVLFADGSRREVGNPLKVGSPVRLLGSSVDQRRFLPPWLCATWDGAQDVIVRDVIDGGEVILPCHSVGH